MNNDKEILDMFEEIRKGERILANLLSPKEEVGVENAVKAFSPVEGTNEEE